MKYLVRQYRPDFVSGFTNKAYRDIELNDITKVPFCENFKHDGFLEFTVKPYGDELIVEAHYSDGKHWVVGFALPDDSTAKASDGGLLRDNWRYQDHES